MLTTEVFTHNDIWSIVMKHTKTQYKKTLYTQKPINWKSLNILSNLYRSETTLLFPCFKIQFVINKNKPQKGDWRENGDEILQAGIT